MNQEKIGKLIAECRREKKLTQVELAKLLGVTDKSVSKWENGVCLPDASNMPDLCKILDISINDLFSGEVVDMKENEKKLEENLLEMTKIKEQRDKELLILEIIIGVIASINMFACIMISALVNMSDWLKVIIVLIGIIPFIIALPYAIRIEQIAGYYECSKCHYKYVPSYFAVLFAMHINRTRRMKCPKCHKRSWHKKVLNK